MAMAGAGCGEATPRPSPAPEITPAAIGRIAFVSQLEGDIDIYVMDADGSNQRNLINSLDADWEPNWSPDGSRIAFGARCYGNWDIYVMKDDGSDQTRLTSGH